MKVALIQMNVGADKAQNIARARSLIERACEDERPDLVVLPECFTFYGATLDEQRASAEPCPGGDGYRMLQEMAAHHGVTICGGSLNERDGDAIYNTLLVFDRSGSEVARYRKIHMFAITTPDGVTFDEGRLYRAGDRLATFDLDGVTIGCAICYDLRFPELFQDLVAQGADVILLPSAFTLQTGKEHWEPLIRARAIETQCYVLAPAQEGLYEEDGETLSTYGHTMVVDPWGAVIARRALGEGIVPARLDRAEVAAARARIPLAAHRAARPRWR